jgi:uncharacterized Ntn-hydrolase superfamily protein
MTYSIVARDAATGELGVAVQTRWFAVGAGVLWAEPGVGAVATQAFSETGHGPNGLAQLREGRTPAEALAVLMAADGGESVRQVGIVSAAGLAAAHTGARCVQAAGHATAPDVSCQANMMERPTVWPAMLAAFSSATGDLADRMLVALHAAEAEGGDVRGHQSAALLVVPGRAGAPPWEHRFDVRVDDAADPLAELARLLRLSRAYEALEAATDAAERGALDEALELFDRARGWAPNDDQITLWQAVTLMAAGRDADARAAYREALAAEARAPEHLRRFVDAGHAAGATEAVRVLVAG